MPDESRCVLTLPLLTEPWQEVIIEKRFRILEQLQNALIAKEKRKLRDLQHTRAWRGLMEQIKAAPDDKTRKALFRQRTKMLRVAGFSEFAFINDMTPMQKHFVSHIAAHVAHHVSSDVWRAFEKFLYGSGQEVHFKKRGTMDSAANKKAGNAMRYRDGVFIWSGGQPKKDSTAEQIVLQIRVAAPKNDYEREMLQREIRYFRIVRKWMKTRYKYYLQFTLKGEPVQKHPPAAPGRVGIDLGTQTIAVVSETQARLLVLADRIDTNHKKLLDLQRRMDASRRATNPDNYNPDGTIRRGVRLIWHKSNRYLRLQGQARELQRKNADIRKYQHCCLANEILQMGSEIYIEPMDFRALQHRAKKTELDVRGRFKKKKRFGRSLANRAPASFRTILNNKLRAQGLPEMTEVDKWEFRASQFDHTDQTYTRKKLGWRWNRLSNGDRVQRDLYAAFLLMNAAPSRKSIDVDLCSDTYETFKKHHDTEIARIRASTDRIPSSFGIARAVRTAS